MKEDKMDKYTSGLIFEPPAKAARDPKDTT